MATTTISPNESENLFSSRTNKNTRLVHYPREGEARDGDSSKVDTPDVLERTGDVSYLSNGTRLLLNVGDDVSSMSWAPSSDNNHLSKNKKQTRVLAVSTRSGPLKNYVQFWTLEWSVGGARVEACKLHSILRRGMDGLPSKGHVLRMHWVPTEKNNNKTSSSSSSSTARLGLLCMVTSFGAWEMVSVPPLLDNALSPPSSSPSTSSAVQLLVPSTPLLSLATVGVRCLSFSKMYGNIVLVGRTKGVVELWRLNTNGCPKATRLKTYDHMYECRHALDDTQHSITAIDWSPHDRHRFVSGT